MDAPLMSQGMQKNEDKGEKENEDRNRKNKKVSNSTYPKKIRIWESTGGYKINHIDLEIPLVRESSFDTFPLLFYIPHYPIQIPIHCHD